MNTRPNNAVEWIIPEAPQAANAADHKGEIAGRRRIRTPPDDGARVNMQLPPR